MGEFETILCAMKSGKFKFISEGLSNKVAKLVKRGTVMEMEPPGSVSVHHSDVSAARPPPRILSFPHFFNWPVLWSVCRLRSSFWNSGSENERGLLQTLHHKSKQVYTHQPTNRRVLVREGWSANLIVLMLLLRLPSSHTQVKKLKAEGERRTYRQHLHNLFWNVKTSK